MKNKYLTMLELDLLEKKKILHKGRVSKTIGKAKIRCNLSYVNTYQASQKVEIRFIFNTFQ